MSSPEQPQTARDDPTFSLTGLVRYLHAKPAARARMIGEQKRPSDIAAMYYDPAADAIRRFIVEGMDDESILTRATARLAGMESEEDAVNAQANIEALSAFQESYHKLDFRALTPSRGEESNAGLHIGGVEVIVRPEIVLGGVVKGERRAGALKLYFSKGHPLSRTTAEYGAALVRRHCEERLADGARVRPQDCSIFEVRTGEIHQAPAAFARRMQEIAAACGEIALRWPTA